MTPASRRAHPWHVLFEFEIWSPPGRPDQPAARWQVLLPRLQRAPMRELPAAPPPLILRDPARLQELFHTMSPPGLQEVPQLCAGLPGVAGCLLMAGRTPLAGWNLPPEIDQDQLLRALAGAMDRAAEPAGQAGWGACHALSLHLGQGSVSLIRRGALALAVFHESGSFAPGVREKLERVLEVVGQGLDLSALPAGQLSETRPVSDGRGSQQRSLA